MSENTLNIIEAVKALDEGKCEEIRSPNGVVYNSKDGCLKYKLSHNETVSFSIQTLLGKWSLIKTEPRTEERTIKYWLVVWEDGQTGIVLCEEGIPTSKNVQQVIPLSHTYTYTFPEETLHPVMDKILNDFEKGV